MPTVLVVDDAAILLQILGELLESHGYRVIPAASADAALRALESESVDVLLSDACLESGSGGVGLIETARERNPALKCILMSGAVEPAWKLRLPFAVLAKPFEPEALLRELEATLAPPKSRSAEGA